MRPCSFATCRCLIRHRRHGITFHEFPKSEEIRTKWVAVVRIDRHNSSWTPSSKSRVCSLHFSRSQFLSKRVLHSRAVPTAKYDPPKFLRPYRRDDDSEQADDDSSDMTDEIPDDDVLPIPKETPTNSNGAGVAVATTTAAIDTGVGASEADVPTETGAAAANVGLEPKEVKDDKNENKPASEPTEEAKDEDKTEKA